MQASYLVENFFAGLGFWQSAAQRLDLSVAGWSSGWFGSLGKEIGRDDFVEDFLVFQREVAVEEYLTGKKIIEF